MKRVLVLVLATLVVALASPRRNTPPLQCWKGGVVLKFLERTIFPNLSRAGKAIVNFLKGFENTYPNIGVSRGNLDHQTAEGRDIPFLKISGGSGFHKKRIFIESGLHGREWMGPAATLYFIDRLLERRFSDSDAQTLFNNYDWYFLPLTNPDGYEYTHTGDRLWRKNRRYMSVDECIQSIIHGVDLNRNFDVDWKNTGSSAVCTSDVYHGPSAFSEPETQVIRDKVREIIHDDGPISAYIAVHAYGQMLTTPYSYTATLPPNHAQATAISNAARDAIKAATGEDYIVGAAGPSAYLASGTGTDWAYVKENITYSLTFSVRPKVGDDDAFNPPPSLIVPTGIDVWAGIHAAVTNL